MGNTSNIAAGKPKITGAIFVAKTGTELPTDAKTELNKEFKQMGYISDNGLENENKIDSDKVKAWGGDTVMTLQKEKTDKFGYELLEVLNVDVIKFVYGENNDKRKNAKDNDFNKLCSYKNDEDKKLCSQAKDNTWRMHIIAKQA